MTDAPLQKVPFLRCKDCGTKVYLDKDCNVCDCGSVWRKQWTFEGDAQIELWTFTSVGKAIRRKNGH